MRLFVAVGLPDPIRASLAGAIERLRSRLGRLRWVRPEGIHLTLKFLGEVAPDRLESLQQALGREVRGACEPFDLLVAGAGLFPARGRPRVLWVGVSQEPGTAGLLPLKEAVENACASCGLPRDTRPFHPHLTLARLGDGGLPEGLEEAVRELDGVEHGRLRVGSVGLIVSRLGPGSARYETLQECPI